MTPHKKKFFDSRLDEDGENRVRGLFSGLGDTTIMQTRQMQEQETKMAKLKKQLTGSEEKDKTSVSKIEIEDFYPHNMKRRYGGIAPPHKKIEKLLVLGSEKYETVMKQFTRFMDQFLSIEKSADPGKPHEPYWINGFFPTLDAIALFGLISIKKPKIYLEIGSGHSTRFAAKAIRLNSPSTQIISIDPPAPGLRLTAFAMRLYASRWRNAAWPCLTS